MLHSRFYKRALRETPTIEWIGITDTDTLFNVSALAWRLLRVSEAVGAPRKRYAVYGLLSGVDCVGPGRLPLTCFDYGPDRGVQAALGARRRRRHSARCRAGNMSALDPA